MALRIHAGNRPKLDGEGFVHAVLKTIEMDENPEIKGENVRWEFESAGTLRPMTFRIWTGLTYNPPDDNGHANKLVRLCLQFQVFTMEQLVADALPDIDLEALIGQCVVFKLVKQEGFYKINVDTLAIEA